MRNLLLPALSWPLSFSDQQLGLDLIEIAVGGISIEGNATGALIALEKLNEILVPVSGGGSVKLFNKPRRTRASRPLIAAIVAEEKNVNGNQVSPLMGGRLVAREGTMLLGDMAVLTECVHISLQLQLNIPRFISAQTLRPRGRAKRPTVSLPFALASAREIASDEEEVAFGSDANVIMGSPALYAYALSKTSSDHFFNLVDAVSETIVNWLRGCPDLQRHQIVYRPTYTLSRAEWYVEFETKDPRRQISRLMPLLSRQGKAGNVFRRRLTGQVKTFGKYSHAMQIELSKGIKQTTYSKTNRRIRFETKYRRSCFHRLFGKRTGLSRQKVGEALEVLRVHARRQLVRIFETLSAGIEPSNEGLARDDLVGCIYHFCDHLAYAEEICRSLRDTGRVTVENGSVLRATIKTLREEQVLRFVRHSVYTVTDEFEAALRDLMAQPGAAMARQARIN